MYRAGLGIVLLCSIQLDHAKIKKKNRKGVTTRQWSTSEYLIELGACLLIRQHYNYPAHIMQMGRKTLADIPHIMHPRESLYLRLLFVAKIYPGCIGGEG